MTTTLTLVDGSNTIPLAVGGIPSPNAVLVKDYDFGYPDVREVKSDLAGQDGELDLTLLHGGRVVTINVSVLDIDGQTRHQTMDMLRAACLPSHQPKLFILQDGWTEQRVMNLRGQPVSCVVGQSGHSYLEASLSWLCAQGSMLSATLSEVIIVPNGGALVGLSWPNSFPLSWVPGSAGDRANVVNMGTENTTWTASIYGMFSSLAITNRTTGDSFTANINVPVGHVLTIDTAAKTVLLDGVSAFDTVDFTGSSWFPLLPGTNDIQVTANTSNANALCNFSWQDRWV